MDRAELLKKIKQLAKSKELAYSFDKERGKGSHGTVYLGDAFATVPKGELKKGTLNAICKQLGIDKDEL